MSARIYVFKRKDGTAFQWATDTLALKGYKLRITPKGHCEAVPPETVCVCPDCRGTGSFKVWDKWYPCFICNGQGTY
jgi:hypothetical protein